MVYMYTMQIINSEQWNHNGQLHYQTVMNYEILHQNSKLRHNYNIIAHCTLRKEKQAIDVLFSFYRALVMFSPLNIEEKRQIWYHASKNRSLYMTFLWGSVISFLFLELVITSTKSMQLMMACQSTMIGFVH